MVKRNDKQNREILNNLPEVSVFEIDGPFGFAEYSPLTLHPFSWLSWLIRRFRNVPANHNGVFYRDERNKFKCIEANEKGVVKSKGWGRLERFAKKKAIVVALIPKHEVNMRSLRLRADLEEGKKYGFFGLLQWLKAVLGRHQLRSKALRTGKVSICSVTLMRVLLGKANAWKYSPKEVWDYDFEKKRLIL